MNNKQGSHMPGLNLIPPLPSSARYGGSGKSYTHRVFLCVELDEKCNLLSDLIKDLAWVKDTIRVKNPFYPSHNH